MKLIKAQKQEANMAHMPLGAGQIIFLGLIAAFAVFVFAFSMDLQFLSRILPMTLGTVTLLVAAALLYHMTRKTEGPNPARFDDELVGENATKAPPEHQLLWFVRSEEHTSELKSLMRLSYAVLCLKKKKTQ